MTTTRRANADASNASKKRPRASIVAATLAFGLVSPRLARADGVALDRFEPAERGSEWFAADSLDLRGHLRPTAGATLDWGYKPLVASTRDLKEQAAIVRHQVFAHVGGSVVLWERVRVGLSLPLAVHQSGEDARVGTQTLTAPSGAAVGDLRLGADVRVLGAYGDPLTVAVGTWVFAPTGSQSQLTSDGSLRLSPHALVAGDVGPFVYAGRIGPNLRFADPKFFDARLGTELAFALGAGVRTLSKKLVIGPEMWGSTNLGKGDPFAAASTPIELGVGGHYTKDSLRFGLGGGTAITYGYGAPQARVLASIEWIPPFEKPAPPPEPDSDGDGVLDREDACVRTPGVRDADPRKNGCPPDRDGDGVLDSEDACVDVAGVRNADPKKNGCPPEKIVVAPPTDRDGDGVFDTEDACPDVQGARTTDPKTNGCPLVAVVGKEIKISEQVRFSHDSALIEKDSERLLTTIAKTLADNPQIKKVRVEGHTDQIGTDQYNTTLSQQRAQAVVDGLVRLGVDRSRLRAEGFGRSQPLDKNDTEAGRANNRRVELHIEDAGQQAVGSHSVRSGNERADLPMGGKIEELAHLLCERPGRDGLLDERDTCLQEAVVSNAVVGVAGHVVHVLEASNGAAHQALSAAVRNDFSFPLGCNYPGLQVSGRRAVLCVHECSLLRDHEASCGVIAAPGPSSSLSSERRSRSWWSSDPPTSTWSSFRPASSQSARRRRCVRTWYWWTWRSRIGMTGSRARVCAAPSEVGHRSLVLSDPEDGQATGRALGQGATDFVVRPIRGVLLGHRIRLLVSFSHATAGMEEAKDGAARAQQLARYVQWKLDPDARTFRWSDRADAVFGGLEGEGLVDDALLRWVHPNDRARVEASLGEAGPQHIEYRLVLGNGDERVVHQASALAPDAVTGRSCVTGTVQDMTGLRDAEAHADHLAYYDDLTDLPNRAHAERYLKGALATAKARNQKVGVVSLDLDLFRRVNDSLGHSGGNAVLQEVARRLKTIAKGVSWERRPEPMFARLGGDEFVVILRDVRSHEEVATFFRSLAARLGEPYFVEGTKVVISCSAGIAIHPENGADVDTLLRHADAALHAAKASGRDGFQVFDLEVQHKLDRKIEIESRLRAALASGDSLELHYQPKVESPSGRVGGVEALLRWRGDAAGTISPTDLVAVAEETGLIQQLGDWVLRTACLQAKAWSEHGPRPIRIAVNVSARQFSAPDFDEKVAALLTEIQIAPSLLELEITEGMMMFDTAVTSRVLARLKLLGLRIALDDFGTGYSSLAYLTRFPVDCLKIDRSFIKEIGKDQKSETIVSAVIALARSLSIDIVAEGVETPSQRAFLERFGMLAIQGWLFSKALPPDLAAAWIVRHEESLGAPDLEEGDREPLSRSA